MTDKDATLSSVGVSSICMQL